MKVKATYKSDKNKEVVNLRYDKRSRKWFANDNECSIFEMDIVSSQEEIQNMISIDKKNSIGYARVSCYIDGEL